MPGLPLAVGGPSKKTKGGASRSTLFEGIPCAFHQARTSGSFFIGDQPSFPSNLAKCHSSDLALNVITRFETTIFPLYQMTAGASAMSRSRDTEEELMTR